MTYAAYLDPMMGALIVQAVADDSAGVAVHFKTKRCCVAQVSRTVVVERATGNEALATTPSAD